MKKVLILSALLMLGSLPVFAEKIPVRISPTKPISTHHDEVELGDWLPFEIVNDVYVNDKLYIKKGTLIFGFVDFFHPNGWVTDSAEIKFEKFKTKDASGREVVINYPLTLNGDSVRDNDMKVYVFKKIIAVFRGPEISIEPDTKAFNLFITR